MKYVIDEKVANNLGMSFPEVLASLLVKTGTDIPNLLMEMEEKEMLVCLHDGYQLTGRWNDVCDNILLTSDKTVPTDSELMPLAEALMQIFPQGKKPGTPYYWKCNKREISLKLKSFYKLFGNRYTPDEILDAAQRYVDSFHGDYTYMRLLKYFIWKKDRETNEEISELATFIDNGDQVDEDSNWINNLI